jgi:hypothetical protein
MLHGPENFYKKGNPFRMKKQAVANHGANACFYFYQ